MKSVFCGLTCTNEYVLPLFVDSISQFVDIDESYANVMLFFRPYKSSLYETTEMFSQKAELVSSLIKLWGGNVLIVNKLL